MSTPPKKSSRESLLYKAVLQQSHDGIVIINNKGIIQKVNPATQRIFGYSEEELLDHNISMLMPDHHAREHDKYLEKYTQTRHENILNRHVKLTAVRKSGEHFPIDLSVSEIICENEQLFSGLIKDISTEEKAKQQLESSYQLLEASNRELESFAYSISHDLRTPLRGIDGFSLALLEDFKDRLPIEATAYIERIRANTIKMGEMISSLLSLSRHAQEPIRIEHFNLSDMVRDSFTQLISLQPRQDNIHFSCQSSVYIHADPKLFSIVIDNLLNNALKYSSNNDYIKIEFATVSHSEKQICYIRDNGSGFDMRHINKLFQVFQRLHRPDEYSGIGIGLATVDKIIKRHNGEIWAESEPGKGSTFYFTLD